MGVGCRIMATTGDECRAGTGTLALTGFWHEHAAVMDVVPSCYRREV